MKKIRNVITALVTPFKENGEIDFDAFSSLIEWQIDSGVSGFVVAGTTGESPTLSAEEKLALFRFSVDEVKGRVPIIAGTGTNDTRASIEFGQRAVDTGVDASLVVVPYYNRPSQKGLISHFVKIADSGGLPVMLYNVPGRTIVDLEHESVLALAEHDNIFAIKEATTASRMNALKLALPDDFLVFSGEDSETITAICDNQSPVDGVISVTSNVAPKMMSQMCKLSRKDKKASGEIAHQLSGLNRALFCDSNPSPAKYALSEVGRIDNVLRLPLLPITAECEDLVSCAMIDKL